jgi:hypothetical protein
MSSIDSQKPNGRQTSIPASVLLWPLGILIFNFTWIGALTVLTGEFAVYVIFYFSMAGFVIFGLLGIGASICFIVAVRHHDTVMAERLGLTMIKPLGLYAAQHLSSPYINLKSLFKGTYRGIANKKIRITARVQAIITLLFLISTSLLAASVLVIVAMAVGFLPKP